MTQKVKVQCTFVIEVEVSSGMSLGDIKWEVEERGCPGTGLVGARLEEIREECDGKSVCWACNLRGENRVLEVDGRVIQME